MVRILHFVSSPEIGSGVMTVIMNYYRNIDRKRFHFDFLCFIKPEAEKSYQREIEALGGTVYYIPKPSISSLPSLRIFFQKYAGTYDWLHNHEIYLTWLLRPISKANGIEHFIVHCHATKYSDRRLAALRNRFLCLPIRYMKGIYRFACSKAAGNFLYGKRCMRQRNVFVMYNAINAQDYAFDAEGRKRVRSTLGYTDKDIVLGNVGRFVPQKNQIFLLELLAILQKLNTNTMYKLLLIGEGPLEENLKSYAKSLGVYEQVCFYGRSQAMQQMLSAMDVFLLPSMFEGLPMSLVEAQANGLVCIIGEAVTQEALLSKTAKRLPLTVRAWEQALQPVKARSTETSDDGVDKKMEQNAAFDIRKAVRRLERVYNRIGKAVAS